MVAPVVCDIVSEPGFLEHVKTLSGRFADRFAGAPFGLRQRGLTMGLETGREDGAFDAWQRRVRDRPYPFLLPDHYER